MSNRLFVLACLLVLAPTTASAIFFPATSKGSGSPLFSGLLDVALTPAPPAPPVPIPYPVSTTRVENPLTKKTQTTTKVVIKSENYRRSSGDDTSTGIFKGLTANNKVGFAGDILRFSYDVKIEGDESAVFSIILADPLSGRPIGPDYVVEVTDTRTGRVDFDISDPSFVEFDIILLASLTTGDAFPRSKLALTDIALDDASIAESFAVRVVPIPAAIWLFGSALVALIGFSKRSKAA